MRLYPSAMILFLVFGPGCGDDDKTTCGDGTQTRSIQHVSDLVKEGALPQQRQDVGTCVHRYETAAS